MSEHDTQSISAANTAECVELPVFLEDQDELITLRVSPAQAEKASRDSQYLQHLLNKHNERSSLHIIKKVEQLPAAVEKGEPSNYKASDQNEDSESDVKSENTLLYIWTPKCVHLLLSLYEQYEDEFKLGAKRRQTIWEKVSVEMAQHGYKISWTQCQSKMNGLKRTFKKILDHNNISGNDRKTWPYFDKMNEIFGSTGWVQPKMLATEAGPSSAVGNPKTDGEEKTAKKRKLETVLEQFHSEVKANQQAARDEREASRREWNAIKAKKFDELMAQKERQHREKINMLQLLVESISKNSNQ